MLWDDAGAGCQGQDKGAGEVRLRCLCFSWGCQLPPIYSPPPTQARKRSECQDPSRTQHPPPPQQADAGGNPSPQAGGAAGSGGGLQVRFQGSAGVALTSPWQPPASGSSELSGLERRPEVVRTRARDTKQTSNDTQHGGMGVKKKNPPVHK